MKLREATVWKLAAGICLLPAVSWFVSPGLREWPPFLPLRQCAFGVFVSIAVGATILHIPQWPGEGDAEIAVRRQKLAATIMGVGVICPMLVWAEWQGQFANIFGWILLPVVFIGPVLYLRDWLVRCREIT